MAAINTVEAESFRYTMGDRMLIRPFSGIPNDYPNYELVDLGRLRVNFPNGNPFFKNNQYDSTNAMEFHIQLPEYISPYGVGLAAYAVNYDYSRLILPQVELYTLNVSIPGKHEVAERINEQLDAWSDEFPGTGITAEMLNSFAKWYSSIYRLQPSIGLWRNYLSVSYSLNTYDGPSQNMPMLYSICFDINTGDAVWLPDVLPDNLDYSAAHGFERADFSNLEVGEYPSQEYLHEGFSPEAGAEITDAWLAYNGLLIYLTEPSGRILQIFFGDMPVK